MSEIVLMAINNVLRPMLENLVSYESKFNVDCGESLCLIILSAPFVYIFITPFAFIITDILFLSDVKLNTYKSS